MPIIPCAVPGARRTGQQAVVVSPFTRKPVGIVERSTTAMHAQALRNAAVSFEKETRVMPAYQRAQILYRMAEQAKAASKKIALTIAREGGKPLTDALAEAERAVNTIKMCGDTALCLNAETLSMDRAPGTERHLAFRIREPVGPVLAVSAFNHPFNLTAHLIAPAIAAGCPVILKPASATPLSSFLLRDFATQAGLPARAFQIVTPAGRETMQLVTAPEIRSISFIGSARDGWQIKAAVQPGVGVTLEHGGTAAAIVDASADLTRAIPSLTKAGYYHAGQA